MNFLCTECNKGAEFLCECARTAYCSRDCQKKNSYYHFLNCRVSRKAPQWNAIYSDILRKQDAAWGVTAVKPYELTTTQFTEVSEYQNIFEALDDIRDEKGERIFSWYADCIRDRDFWKEGAREDGKNETSNFTGFIPDNAAIARWASEIGIAEAESEFNADYDDPNNIDRGETVRQIKENLLLQLILVGHLTPDILPPTRGIEGWLQSRWYTGLVKLPRNEALEPFAPDGAGGRENKLDLLPFLEQEDFTDFRKDYGELEIRKVFDGEIQKRRELLKNDDLSPYRVKFVNQTITSDIIFNPMHVFRAQNSYIYRIQNVLGKPDSFFQRRVYRKSPRDL